MFLCFHVTDININHFNHALSNIMNARGTLSTAYSCRSTLALFPLFSTKIFLARARVSRVGDHLVGGVVFACMRACTRVHCLLLSTKDRRIRFPKLSSTRRLGFSFQTSRRPLFAIALHICICFPKGLELTAIILFTFSSYDPLMCLRCYLDLPHWISHRKQRNGSLRALNHLKQAHLLREIDISYRAINS